MKEKIRDHEPSNSIGGGLALGRTLKERLALGASVDTQNHILVQLERPWTDPEVSFELDLDVSVGISIGGLGSSGNSIWWSGAVDPLGVEYKSGSPDGYWTGPCWPFERYAELLRPKTRHNCIL